MPQTQLQLSEAKLASVRRFPETLYGASPRTLLFQIASIADEAPPWWSPARDGYLREFWQAEPFLASAIYSLCARNAGFRWEVLGPTFGKQHVDQVLSTAEFGEGWQELMLKVSLDHYSTDNGGFMEIIRPARAQLNGKVYPAISQRDRQTGDVQWYAVVNAFGSKQAVEREAVSESPADWPIGLAHLDSARCTRTGNPDTPVIYRDSRGRQHEMTAWQVITLADMPSAIEDMHGVGFSMVSRVLRHAQTARDYAVYRSEKISGRFARAVHLTNVDADLISDAIAKAQTQADERGLSRYSQPIITNTINPDGRPYNVTIPLAELPENWDEDTMMRWYIGLVALAAGEHYSFFAPMPGRRLGSAREVEVQERQARGKSSRLFMESLTAKLQNSGMFPPGVVFRFKEKDEEEKAANEEGELKRARTRRERIESGEITPEIARQIAADDGDLDERYLQLLGEHDITPEEPVGPLDEMAAREQQPGAIEGELETATEPTQPSPGREAAKQGDQPPEPWGDEPVAITVEDIARAIAKWNARLPEGAEDLLLAVAQEPADEEEQSAKQD